ncbi:MAG: hypothetical protein KY466_08355 [Gemmatimonadetes bacterium]|nr:hypothetical protein [Gemmatimonadota bacterium]
MKGIGRMVTLLAAAMGLGACGGDDLDTRTFELMYLQARQARQLVAPYVYTDREGAPGTFEISDAAVTVRETPDNLAKIERMLAEFDRPRPLTMLHFQIIRANGATDPDPAIAEVERELRRLFRFEGYDLLAEARIGVMEGASFRQLARGEGQAFHIVGGVLEVRTRGESATMNVEVQIWAGDSEKVLETQVTIPMGHAIVLGTAETESAGALILVVRAEVAGAESPPRPASADTAASPG